MLKRVWSTLSDNITVIASWLTVLMAAWALIYTVVGLASIFEPYGWPEHALVALIVASGFLAASGLFMWGFRAFYPASDSTQNGSFEIINLTLQGLDQEVSTLKDALVHLKDTDHNRWAKELASIESRMAVVESSLLPRTGILSSRLIADVKKADRIDQLEVEIQKLQEKLNLEAGQSSLKAKMLSTSIKAKEALHELEILDAEAIKLTGLLKEASSYPNETAWLGDYEVWDSKMSTINSILWDWFPDHPSLKHHSSEALQQTSEPSNKNLISSTKATIAYSQVSATWSAYTVVQREIFPYLRRKVMELPD